MDSSVGELINEKATLAARHAERRLGACLDCEDFKDTVQSAAEGFWRAWSKKPGEIGYAYVAARNEATKFIIRSLWGKNPHNTLPLMDEVDDGAMLLQDQLEAPSDLPEDVMQELHHIFLESRNKKGERGMAASRRDVIIVNMLHKEWSNIAIATMLDISVDLVKKCRYRIRQVLEMEKNHGTRRVLVQQT